MTSIFEGQPHIVRPKFHSKQGFFGFQVCIYISYGIYSYSFLSQALQGHLLPEGVIPKRQTQPAPTSQPAFRGDDFIAFKARQEERWGGSRPPGR